MPEQFCYLEFEYDGGKAPEEILDIYHRIQEEVKVGFGLDDSDWHELLDGYLEKKAMVGDPGLLEALNAEQKKIINEIKKSYKRAKYQAKK